MIIDPLAEIVTLLRPTARFSKYVECAGTWRIHRQTTGEPFYCAILEGECRIISGGQQAIVLKAGDFVLVPAMHDLVNESLDAPEGNIVTVPQQIEEGYFRAGHRDGPPDLRMRIGHCSFGSPDAALLVSLLPDVVLVRGEPRLLTLMQMIGEETRARRPARDIVLERLLEVLLIEALRCGASGTASPGLARGLADDRLAVSLRTVHARPGYPWTVTELAAEASLSRSAFFARFARVVGLPPMEYLHAWRMALARQLLRKSELGIEQVAEHVGYGSASTFTVAFTRHVGMPPARYARLKQ